MKTLKTVARYLASYSLDLVGVQEVKWDEWGALKEQRLVALYTEILMPIIRTGDCNLLGDNI